MTERYSRPRTPPGPPPLGMPRKNSNPSLSPRPASSQPLSSRDPMSSKPSYRGPTKDIDVKPYDSKASYGKCEKYNKYDKMYPSKMYDDSKYEVSVVRKSADKYDVSNYPARSDTYKYSEPVYKGKDSSYLSDRYGEVKYPNKDSRYQADSRYTGKYEDQYPIADDQYISKYGSSKKDPVYSGKVGRVSKYDDEKYYDNGSPYSSYDAYGSGPRMGASTGGGMGGGAGSSYYDDKFSRPLPKRYLEPDREPYPDYNGVPRRDSRYLDYDRYSPPREPRRSPERQYLDRYVIGDSVVYGSPGYYPRDLRPPSPRGRPPSPTPASSTTSRNYRGSQRYTPPSSPRGRDRQPKPSEGRPLVPRDKAGYSSLSRRSPLRRPPSPPSPPGMSRTTPPPPRRPPSPPSPYQRSNKTSTTTAATSSYNRNQSKERYPYKARTTSNLRSPVRQSHTLPSSTSRTSGGGTGGGNSGTTGTGGGVVGVSGGSSSAVRRDSGGTRDYHQAHRHKETTSSTTSSLGKSSNTHTSQYHRTERSREALDLKKSGSTSGRSSDYRDNTLRDSRRGRTPERTNDSRRDVKAREPEPSSRDRVRSGRRIEDRLGPSSSGGRTRVRSRSRSRSPAHGGRRSSSRDRKSRRPDDLRLWIELRKSESSKRPTSPNRSRQPPAKRLTRPDVGGASSRLRDPKRRMGKGKRRPLPTKGSKLVRKAAGSAANIRRVLKKPKNISKVNRLAVKPRVLKKATTQKLLKDGKETSSGGGGSGNGGGSSSSSSKKQEKGEKSEKSGDKGNESKSSRPSPRERDEKLSTNVK
ncbi:uncharacterized protein LOC143022636 isoform X2 [Oratosquilla oratoria]|uniref:uncharacterized protein LOC143022636 isoform X2 n=1 Tax=Oratosquilla oratoria TaxID=337810 RepID=UPI003F761E0C